MSVRPRPSAVADGLGIEGLDRPAAALSALDPAAATTLVAIEKWGGRLHAVELAGGRSVRYLCAGGVNGPRIEIEMGSGQERRPAMGRRRWKSGRGVQPSL